MIHYVNGEPCNCKVTVTDDGEEYYAEMHPNKEPSFNEQVAESIAKSNATRGNYV